MSDVGGNPQTQGAHGSYEAARPQPVVPRELWVSIWNLLVPKFLQMIHFSRALDYNIKLTHLPHRAVLSQALGQLMCFSVLWARAWFSSPRRILGYPVAEGWGSQDGSNPSDYVAIT